MGRFEHCLKRSPGVLQGAMHHRLHRLTTDPVRWPIRQTTYFTSPELIRQRTVEYSHRLKVSPEGQTDNLAADIGPEVNQK